MYYYHASLADDEIICKTVSHKESTFLQSILPAYYLNLHQNVRTLLPKFFGFYCYSCKDIDLFCTEIYSNLFAAGNTKNVRIICMKNLLPSDLEMHHKFDLKGSTYKRKASRKERNKANPTFKGIIQTSRHAKLILVLAVINIRLQPAVLVSNAIFPSNNLDLVCLIVVNVD